MKYASTRFVFDRKKTASRVSDALVQIEILFERKKKYITTGVRLYKGQWDEKHHVYRRNDSDTLNGRIDAQKGAIDKFITQLMKEGVAFTWERLDDFLRRDAVKDQTFIEYIEQRIDERTDITYGTKKNHWKLITSLHDYGRIITFDQLTRPNIAGYYEWLLGREIEKIGVDGRLYKTRMAPQTVQGYMKTLRTYIHDAMVHDRLDKDPSFGIHVKRGEALDKRWLSEDEVRLIEDVKLSSGSLVRARDLFIFSCYSGLAYSDIMDFKAEKLEKDGKDTFLTGKRVKTGQEYIVLVLPKVQEILEKYDYQLPKYSNQQYNSLLKDVAAEAGVNKRITSHWGRHTAGVLFLNNGVRLEVVSKILGHASSKITEKVYTSVLKKTVVKEMSVLK